MGQRAECQGGVWLGGSSRGMCFWGDPQREMGLMRAGLGEGSVFPSLGQFLGAAASPPGQEVRTQPSDPEFGAQACLGLMGLCQPRSTHWAWCPHKSRETLVWEETWPLVSSRGLVGVPCSSDARGGGEGGSHGGAAKACLCFFGNCRAKFPPLGEIL